jgi:3-hydroxyisobutyrate dehydrogenase-like beta-hydroxyacid dehydrogenase
MVGANGSDARATVAVIDAGIMGSAMTRNLVAAGVRHPRPQDRVARPGRPGQPGEAGRQCLLSILIEGVAETMELADRLGIGHQQLAEVIEGGPLDAPIADAKLHKMDRGDYSAEFPLEWALKDVDLAISAAGDETTPLLAALSGQWHAAVAAGHGRQDVSAARLALATPSRSS